jgi:dimeric dUTPase (all-alpha-NTP-PPase superfamily)
MKKVSEKDLKEWFDAVKKFNDANDVESQIEAFKDLLRIGKKLGISEEAIFLRVVKVLSSQE